MPIVRPTLLMFDEFIRKSIPIRNALIRDELTTLIQDFDAACQLLFKLRQQIKQIKGTDASTMNVEELGASSRAKTLTNIQSQFLPSVERNRKQLFADVKACKTEEQLELVKVKWNCDESLMKKILNHLHHVVEPSKIVHTKPVLKVPPAAPYQFNDDDTDTSNSNSGFEADQEEVLSPALKALLTGK